MTHHLFDADTDEDLGLATPEQVDASDESDANGEEGIILIDKDGDVITEQAATRIPNTVTRRVYTETVR